MKKSKIIDIHINNGLNDTNTKSVQSYINFFSLKELILNNINIENISFAPDGITLSIFISIILRKKIRRNSFDMTSDAKELFMQLNENGQTLAIIGAKTSELNLFCHRIKETWPKIDIVYKHNGYFNGDEYKEIAAELSLKSPHHIILGLGTPMQETIASKFVLDGVNGRIYTCGGFIRQSTQAAGLNYYPKIINKLNLRFAYRFIKEPHTRKRYLVDYTIALFFLSYYCLFRKIKFRVGNHE
ncbi:MAG: exopolysaccharide biosynthesis WecB/TagA/CpsF family protein [Psychroserpens sp.]|jgi:exopolysaccharide biosynthesis WecB/TagA/CpsF family protein